MSSLLCATDGEERNEQKDLMFYYWNITPELQEHLELLLYVVSVRTRRSAKKERFSHSKSGTCVEETYLRHPSISKTSLIHSMRDATFQTTLRRREENEIERKICFAEDHQSESGSTGSGGYQEKKEPATPQPFLFLSLLSDRNEHQKKSRRFFRPRGSEGLKNIHLLHRQAAFFVFIDTRVFINNPSNALLQLIWDMRHLFLPNSQHNL